MATCEEEAERKNKLMELFYDHEVSSKKWRTRTRFERAFQTSVIVKTIKAGSIRAERENGEKIAPIIVTPEIAGLLKVGDELWGTFGFCGSQWHIIFMFRVGGEIEDEVGSLDDELVH